MDAGVTTLLKVRRRQKSRKPEFKRYEAHKKLKLKDKSWRRPRGRHSKMRRGIGRKKKVNAGYGSPKLVRGLHPSGFEEVRISTPSELDMISENQAVRIASTVGQKKRLLIEEKAKEMGLKVLNPRVME